MDINSFQKVIEKLTVGIIIAEEKKIAIVNSTAKEIFDIGNARVFQRFNIDKILKPGQRKTWISLFSEIVEGKEKVSACFSLLNIDHDLFAISADTLKISGKRYIQLYFNQANEKSKILKKKESKETVKIQEYEGTYKAYIENAPDGIFIANGKGEYLEVNEAACKMTGYSSKELLKMSILDLFAESEHAAAKAHFEEVKSTGLANGIFPFITKSGEEKVWTVDAVKLDSNRLLGFTKDITEQIETNKKLEESEKKFRALYNDITVAIFRSTPKGQLISCNNALAKMYGYDSIEEILSRPAIEFYTDPNDRTDILDALNESGKYFNRITKENRKDGSTIWVKTNYKAIYNDANEIVYIDGSVLDITDEKISTDALEESEQRLALAIESTDLGLWDQDFKTRKVVRNDRWFTMLGYQPNELADNIDLWLKLTHPDDLDRVMVSKEQHEKAQTEKFSVEQRLRCKDGSYKWIYNFGKIVEREKDGTPVRAIGVHLDINDKKIVETALKESENRFKELVEQMPEGLVIQTDGHIKYVNSAVLKMSGVKSRKELIGKPIKDFFNPKYQKQTLSKIERLLRTKSNRKPIEDRYINSKGLTIPVEVFAREISFEGNKSVQLMIRDISLKKEIKAKEEEYYQTLQDEVTRRTEELNRQTAKLQDSQKALTFLLEDVNDARKEIINANKELETANTDLESFAYSVSHDLRAPLRHIDGFTQILHKKISHQGEEVERYFGKIHDASSRMHELINDLLTFSRLGRSKLRRTPVNLNKIILDVQNFYEPDIAGRDILWEIEDLPLVIGDREMLKIVFDNLISNAIKFTSKKEKAEIKINKVDATDDFLKIAIADNGVGFNMDYVGKIFGVFERLHSTHEFPGTGIGLANVKRIVQGHQGSIEAAAEVDVGATFFLTLPAAIEDKK